MACRGFQVSGDWSALVAHRAFPFHVFQPGSEDCQRRFKRHLQTDTHGSQHSGAHTRRPQRAGRQAAGWRLAALNRSASDDARAHGHTSMDTSKIHKNRTMHTCHSSSHAEEFHATDASELGGVRPGLYFAAALPAPTPSGSLALATRAAAAARSRPPSGTRAQRRRPFPTFGR